MAKRLAKNRTIDVILLEQDKRLGEKYEIVKVKPIFAKNVLFPQKKAVLATPATIHQYKAKMEKAQEEIKRKVASLEDFFGKMSADGGITLVVKANEKGILYDKIDAHEIVKEVQEKYNFSLDVSHVKLKNKITKAGVYKVPYKFKDFERDITVNVKVDAEKEAKSEQNVSSDKSDSKNTKQKEEKTKKADKASAQKTANKDSKDASTKKGTKKSK